MSYRRWRAADILDETRDFEISSTDGTVDETSSPCFRFFFNRRGRLAVQVHIISSSSSTRATDTQQQQNQEISTGPIATNLEIQINEITSTVA